VGVGKLPGVVHIRFRGPTNGPSSQPVNSEQGKSGLVFNTNRGALHGKWIAIATQQLGHVPLSPICTLPRPESLKSKVGLAAAKTAALASI